MKIGEVWTFNDTGQKVKITNIHDGYAEWDIDEHNGIHTWISLSNFPPNDDPLENWFDQEWAYFIKNFTKDYNESR